MTDSYDYILLALTLLRRTIYERVDDGHLGVIYEPEKGEVLA